MANVINNRKFLSLIAKTAVIFSLSTIINMYNEAVSSRYVCSNLRFQSHPRLLAIKKIGWCTNQ